MRQRRRWGTCSRGITRRDVLKLGAAIGSATLIPRWSVPAHAQQTYPSREINLIYGFGPGGSGDLTARITAAYLRPRWNVPINVINKPGGNTVPAVLEVYRAAPDGYTLLADPPGSSSMLAVAVKNLPLKVMDRTFLSMIGTTSLVLAVAPSSPFKTLKDLADEAKRSPETFTWTSGGGASTADYTMRKFAKAIGLDITKTKPVPQRGSVESTLLAAGGDVKLAIPSVSSALPPLRSGLIRAVAVVSSKRWPGLPDVPCVAELGFPEMVVLTWTGLSGPPRLPAYIIEKWSTALQEMVKDPGIIAQLQNIGSIPFYMNPAEFRDYVKKEAAEAEELWSGK